MHMRTVESHELMQELYGRRLLSLIYLHLSTLYRPEGRLLYTH